MSDRSLIERQRARLAALEVALTQERERLRSLARETEVLAAPADPARTRRLRDDVQRLRKDCDAMVKRMEGNGKFIHLRPKNAQAPFNLIKLI